MFKKLGPTQATMRLATKKSPSTSVNSWDASVKKTATGIRRHSTYPNHLKVLATVMGRLQDGSVPQDAVRSAWWFNDHIEGMLRQMESLANIGLLSRFVGMLTDSRSLPVLPTA